MRGFYCLRTTTTPCPLVQGVVIYHHPVFEGGRFGGARDAGNEGMAAPSLLASITIVFLKGAASAVPERVMAVETDKL